MTEGQGVEVTLSGEAVGVYANPIAIGVVCAETIATDVEPGTSASIACFVRLVAVIDLHACITTTCFSFLCVYSFPRHRLQLCSRNQTSFYRGRDTSKLLQ